MSTPPQPQARHAGPVTGPAPGSGHAHAGGADPARDAQGGHAHGAGYADADATISDTVHRHAQDAGHEHEHDHAHGLGHDHDHDTGREHDHAHGHAHEPGHAHGLGHAHVHLPPDGHHRAFAIGILLNAAFVAIEAWAGWYSGSLALLSDAGHNVSDVLGLLLAWAGVWAAQRAPSERFTWGWRRATLLAALVNASLLLAALGAIAWEATHRLASPVEVDTSWMIGVAAVGIAVNGLTAWLFVSGQRHDVNLRGAFLHMVADAAVSAGVVVGGLAVAATGWQRLDPAIGIAIALLVGIGTVSLLRQSLALAMDAVPAGIDPAAVRRHLLGLPGVADLHDLHIWPLGSAGAALSAHIVMPGGHPGDAFLESARASLHRRFRIEHTTLQVEMGDGAGACTQDCGGPAQGRPDAA
jgi:cobalt-zinc-cadmium efflux system protein